MVQRGRIQDLLDQCFDLAWQFVFIKSHAMENFSSGMEKLKQSSFVRRNKINWYLNIFLSRCYEISMKRIVPNVCFSPPVTSKHKLMLTQAARGGLEVTTPSHHTLYISCCHYVWKYKYYNSTAHMHPKHCSAYFKQQEQYRGFNVAKGWASASCFSKGDDLDIKHREKLSLHKERNLPLHHSFLAAILSIIDHEVFMAYLPGVARVALTWSHFFLDEHSHRVSWGNCSSSLRTLLWDSAELHFVSPPVYHL